MEPNGCHHCVQGAILLQNGLGKVENHLSVSLQLAAAFDQNLLGLRSTFQDLNLVSILGVTRLKPNSALEVRFQSRFPGLLYCANAVLLLGP